MAFMLSSLDDGSIPANARVWDFVMPPKSCSTLPLSSDSLVCEIFHLSRPGASGHESQAERNVEGRILNDGGVTQRVTRKDVDDSVRLFLFRTVYAAWSS